MKNTCYLMVMEYDGTGFSGWQKQPGLRTVQSAVEAALERIVHTPVTVVAAGRTDKGVHALGQAVSCAIPDVIEPKKLLIALNAQLPKDVAVVSVRKAPSSFNARFDAKKKTYRYTVWNRPNRTVLLKSRSWHISAPLDIAAMRKAAAALQGKHDFSAFNAAGGGQENMLVGLSSAAVTRRAGTVLLSFTADRFLYKMVRNMVGTLVMVGRGKQSPEDMKRILRSGKRSHAGPTAPPQGLCLTRVYY
jgi:tRNA pseudouridine38-40 synthase